MVSSDSDPAVVCDRLMRRTLLLQCMEELLSPRELNLVRSYLGIGRPDDNRMTFQELAIRLNYNGPSGAEKAYKAALRKLKRTCTAALTDSGSPFKRPSASPWRRRHRTRINTRRRRKLGGSSKDSRIILSARQRSLDFVKSRFIDYELYASYKATILDVAEMLDSTVSGEK